MNLLIRWAIMALALYLTVSLGVGVHMPRTALGTLLVTAAVIGLVNAVVRPVLVLVTLPLTVVSLGLFLLVVNAIALWLASLVTPLTIDGFGGAVVGALLLSVLNMLLTRLFRDKRR
ncbi:MAG: phage holin family protein [Deinococcales bacterium]|nr:phage holin family protein [Deinococcales bacterium]